MLDKTGKPGIFKESHFFSVSAPEQIIVSNGSGINLEQMTIHYDCNNCTFFLNE